MDTSLSNLIVRGILGIPTCREGRKFESCLPDIKMKIFK